MAVDLTELLENTINEIKDSNQLSVKSKTGVQGGEKTFRDFGDILKLDSAESNRDAKNERDNNGMVSLVELDWNL